MKFSSIVSNVTRVVDANISAVTNRLETPKIQRLDPPLVYKFDNQHLLPLKTGVYQIANPTKYWMASNPNIDNLRLRNRKIENIDDTLIRDGVECD